MKVRNPRTGEADYEIAPLDDAALTTEALMLRTAQPAWAALSVEKRAVYMLSLADAVRRHASAIGKALTTDTGRAMISRIEVDGTSRLIERWVASAPEIIKHAAVQNRQTSIPGIPTCGSLKTLDFLSWLGINVPQWLKNELHHCDDMLAKSVDLSLEIANEIKQFCEAKGIPYGFNIESVSIRKVEIEASEYLLEGVKKLLKKEAPAKVSAQQVESRY